MEAKTWKDTVMSEEEQASIKAIYVKTAELHRPDIAEYVEAVKKRQAEITWDIAYKAGIKEGIRLFAWWKDGEQYVGTCGTTLKEALEEIGSKLS